MYFDQVKKKMFAIEFGYPIYEGLPDASVDNLDAHMYFVYR